MDNISKICYKFCLRFPAILNSVSTKRWKLGLDETCFLSISHFGTAYFWDCLPNADVMNFILKNLVRIDRVPWMYVCLSSANRWCHYHEIPPRIFCTKDHKFKKVLQVRCDNEYMCIQRQWNENRTGFLYRNACLRAVEKWPSGFLPRVAAGFCEQIPSAQQPVQIAAYHYIHIIQRPRALEHTKRKHIPHSNWPHGGLSCMQAPV